MNVFESTAELVRLSNDVESYRIFPNKLNRETIMTTYHNVINDVKSVSCDDHFRACDLRYTITPLGNGRPPHAAL